MQDWAPLPKVSKVSDSSSNNTLVEEDNQGKLHVPSDEERKDRTLEEMDSESQMYRDILTSL